MYAADPPVNRCWQKGWLSCEQQLANAVHDGCANQRIAGLRDSFRRPRAGASKAARFASYCCQIRSSIANHPRNARGALVQTG
jgi:hypothetical protein